MGRWQFPRHLNGCAKLTVTKKMWRPFCSLRSLAEFGRVYKENIANIQKNNVIF